jgi:hypothetical protein
MYIYIYVYIRTYSGLSGTEALDCYSPRVQELPFQLRGDSELHVVNNMYIPVLIMGICSPLSDYSSAFLLFVFVRSWDIVKEM